MCQMCCLVFFFVGQVESLILYDLLLLKLAYGHQRPSEANANLCIITHVFHFIFDT